MSTISAGTTTTTALVQTGDTTGNLVLATGSVPTTALTLNSTTQAATFAGAVTAPSVTTTGTINTANTFGFKNRIINGAMVIDQRNAGASVTIASGNTYTLDRWVTNASQSSKFSVQQSSSAPTGFSNSLLATSLSSYSRCCASFSVFIFGTAAIIPWTQQGVLTLRALLHHRLYAIRAESS